MRLTDEQLRMLVTMYPDDADDSAREELRMRVRYQLLRALPSPEGTCSAGMRVSLDDKGPMSTGYPYHLTEKGRYHSTCSHPGKIEWDEPTGKRRRILDALDKLRGTR